MSAPKDRIWRVPDVATVVVPDGEEVLVAPAEGELEQAMLEALAVLKRYGGTVVISADRTNRALWEDEIEQGAPDDRWEGETLDEELDRWETVGLVFRHQGFVPPMPRPVQHTESVVDEGVEDVEPDEDPLTVVESQPFEVTPAPPPRPATKRTDEAPALDANVVKGAPARG